MYKIKPIQRSSRQNTVKGFFQKVHCERRPDMYSRTSAIEAEIPRVKNMKKKSIDVFY